MATSTESWSAHTFDATTYAELIRQARQAESHQRTWLALEAAHVAGQRQLKAHLETHVLMLGLAMRTRDWGEAAGQVLRLALVPLGHLTGRLPPGNPGRSTVGAFRAMPVRPELVALIEQARAVGFTAGDRAR